MTSPAQSPASPVVHAIEITDVVVEYVRRDGGRVRALDHATLEVAAGRRIGLVGESGSGKSTVAALLSRLLPANGSVTSGRVAVNGRDVLAMDSAEVRALRRDVVGMIPQDPVSSLDPTMRIGRQLRLALPGIVTSDADAAELLDRVRIRDPRGVLRLFPHQISGGMAQRVVIAMTLARNPRVLVADEPTAALDSSVRHEVTNLLFEIADEQDTTVVWLSHDLRSVGRWCERVAVMFDGAVVEEGPAGTVLQSPTHPYTIALAGADPASARPGERIETGVIAQARKGARP
ncbi:MAG: ABC transporter ATP-binding protein [Candidatus Microbacterium colombiense]|nr:MAG: ABC transporter ATP-binding protein [Microbacterium sp.]